jgi:hypothetical protein
MFIDAVGTSMTTLATAKKEKLEILAAITVTVTAVSVA